MTTDTRERRYARPGDADCRHVWRTNIRRWDISGPIEFSVEDDRSRAYTNDPHHREWTIYVCALCDLREAIGTPA